MNKKKILCLSVIIILLLAVSSLWIGIVRKNKEANEPIILTEIKQVELNENNCKYECSGKEKKITIKSYQGTEDCVIIPKEINGYEVEKIDSNAFKKCYNLETIKIAKELKSIVKDIDDFKINKQFESEKYIEYITTREYCEAYIEYMNLSNEEQLSQEVIPNKFNVPASEVYSQEIKNTYKLKETTDENLPSKYDLRDYIDIKVENQDNYGICYAYSALSTIETYLSLKKNETVDLSEIHYAVTTGQGYGGWFLSASSSYYSSMLGPVYENDWAKKDIYGNDLDNDYKLINTYLSDDKAEIDEERLANIQEKMKQSNAVKYVTETIRIPSITKEIKEDETKQDEVKEIRTVIKKHIMEYGSLYAHISMNNYRGYNGNIVLNYQDVMSSSHAINIVGWDDDFSKDNFPANCRPNSDGAYLALNSWGDQWGDNGYFWISYEDRWVETDLEGVVSVEEVPGNIVCKEMVIKNKDTKETLKNNNIIKGYNIEILLNLNIKDVLQDNKIDVKIRDGKNEFTDDIVISGKEILNNTVNLVIDMKTVNYKKGTYIIDVMYGDEKVSKQIEIVSNLYDYEINEDGKGITLTRYNGNEKNIEIPKEYLGYNVNEIGDEAFKDSDIESITVYDNIKTIGKNIISEGVVIYGYQGTPIETYANANNYVFFIIGQDVVNGSYWRFNISNHTLYITNKMISVTNKKDIPWYNFSKSIYVVEFENENIDEIVDYAFYNCSNLNTVRMVDNIEKIEKYAFYSCKSLIEIDLPHEINTIGACAFGYCINLKSIEIPNNVTKIEKYTFDNCTRLEYVKLGDETISIGNNVFDYCINLKTIKLPEKIKEIGDFAFSHCDNLKRIELPDTVEVIGNSLFEECIELSYVKLPSGLKSIPDNTFFICYSLTEIELPLEVTNIGKYAFCYCVNLKSISMPEKLTNIGISAFSNCHKLENINIPESVEYISNNAFFQCINLKNIELPSKLTTIEDNVFYGCSSLTNINISNNIVKIGKKSFYKCNSLLAIDIPSTVKEIGQLAFGECTDLESIKLPDIIDIGEDAFNGAVLNIKVDFKGGEEEKIEMPDILKRIKDSKDILYDPKGVTVTACSISQYIISLKYNQIGVITVNEGKMKGFSIEIEGNIPKLTKLNIKQEPNKIVYNEGEDFDPEGMIIEATYSDGSIAIIEKYTILSGRKLTCNQTYVKIMYYENNVSRKVNQSIVVQKIKSNNEKKDEEQNNNKKPNDIKGDKENVSDKKDTIKKENKKDNKVNKKTVKLSSIKIVKEPSKTNYKEGERFDISGMKIKAIYSDGTSKEVKTYIFEPYDKLKVSDKTVSIIYKENGVTKTVKCKINVEKNSEQETIEENKENKESEVKDQDNIKDIVNDTENIAEKRKSSKIVIIILITIGGICLAGICIIIYKHYND